MSIFLAVFAAIVGAGIVLQALAGAPAARSLLRSVLNVLGIGMVVCVGLVLVLYLANVSQYHTPPVQAPQVPVAASTAAGGIISTVIVAALMIAFMTGLALLTAIVVIMRVIHEFRVPHVHTKLGYSRSADAAFYEPPSPPSRNYCRLGY